MTKLNTTLIMTANDQSVAAWKQANAGAVEFTRVDISEYYLYARINGTWQYIANSHSHR